MRTWAGLLAFLTVGCGGDGFTAEGGEPAPETGGAPVMALVAETGGMVGAGGAAVASAAGGAVTGSGGAPSVGGMLAAAGGPSADIAQGAPCALDADCPATWSCVQRASAGHALGCAAPCEYGHGGDCPHGVGYCEQYQGVVGVRMGCPPDARWFCTDGSFDNQNEFQCQ